VRMRVGSCEVGRRGAAGVAGPRGRGRGGEVDEKGGPGEGPPFRGWLRLAIVNAAKSDVRTDGNGLIRCTFGGSNHIH
jgi:hypothetical protein